MATATAPPPGRTLTLADVLIDDLAPSRILLAPIPGTATAADAVAVQVREGRLCELVAGILVEKAMGARESLLAMLLGHHLLSFVLPRNLGVVLGADGMIQLRADQVRIPDVAFFRAERLTNGALPDEPITTLVPDLAVEVLSPSNSKQEMDRKLGEYFAAGVRLVWYADPRRREVWVFDAADRGVCLDHAATLDGGEVLPGFALRVGDWLR